HNDRRDDDACAEFAIAFGEQARVDHDFAANLFDPLVCDLPRQIANDSEGISYSFAIRPTIGVIHAFKSERVIGLNTAGQIGISARDQNDVSVKRSIFVNWPRPVDKCVEAIVSTEQFEQSTFGQEFRGRSWDHEFACIELEQYLMAIQRVELNAKRRV